MNHPERMLRVPDVLALLGISESTLWRWVQKGFFPRPTKLGSHISVWPESTIANWQQQQREKDYV